LATSFGSGAMTNSIGEIEGNDVLFIIGSNATEAHPIIGNKMKRAARNGKKLIVIDPRRTELADYAEYFLQLKSGTDVILINGLINIIIENNWQASDYIKERCEGYDVMLETVKKYTPDYVSGMTGIPEDTLHQAAKLYATTEKAGIFYTLGITEHTHGTDNVMSLGNLAMVTGHVGIENAGVNPLRGQNNVQGACDMGALPNTFPGYKNVFDPAAHEFFKNAWGVEKLDDKVGLKIPEMFEEAVAGKLKGMYVMGEDPVLTDPDANHVKHALKSLDFLVVQNLFMTETAKLADVFLPAACYAEKEGTFTNTERRVQRVRKAVDAPGDCRLDWVIIQDIANRIGGCKFEFTSAEDIWNELRKVAPGFAGISYERIDKAGIQWPCPTDSHPGTKFLHQGSFTRGLGNMQAIEYRPSAETTDKEYPMLLITGRMLYHYNVTTRYSKRLDALRPYELAQINPYDAAKLDLKEEDEIRVTSRRGTVVTRVTVTDRVQPGSLFMTFHYWESPVNEVTSGASDPVTKTGEYKVAAIKVEKVANGTLAEDTAERLKTLE
jgi:formate dehydrogenase alpha subunit